jgi:glycosyltransferase involved in cell wall biosynthesis
MTQENSIHRILIVNDSIQEIGGAESYAISLSQSLNNANYSTQLFGPRSGIGLRNSFFSRWYSRKYYKIAKKAIDSFRPDIVHAHNVSRVLSPSVLKAAKDKGIIVVQTVHDYHYICPKLWMVDDKGREINNHNSDFECLAHHLPKKNIIYSIPKHLKARFHGVLVSKYVDAFICPSKNLQNFYSQKYPNKKIIYIPNFIPADVKVITTNSPKRLLFIGRLSPEKGVDTLIKGFGEALKKESNLLLTIIGSGPEENSLKHLVATLKLSQQVKFLGNIKHKQISEYFNDASAIVVPSTWIENCPMVALEAIGSGKPIIACNAGGLKDLVQNGTTGYLFKRNDHEDLADKIVKLFSNSNNLANFTTNQKKLKNTYSAKLHIKNLTKVYESLINHE